MKCAIAYEIDGRIRFASDRGRYTIEEFDHLDYFFSRCAPVTDYTIYERTGNFALRFEPADRAGVLAAVAALNLEEEMAAAVPAAYPTNSINFEYKHALEDMVLRRIVYRLVLPYPLRVAVTLIKSLKYFKELLDWILRRSEEIQVLDIAAVIASIATGQFDAAGNIIFLLNLGKSSRNGPINARSTTWPGACPSTSTRPG